ncbi:DUF2530 domain-containing protein [Terrabacter sp. AAH1]
MTDPSPAPSAAPEQIEPLHVPMLRIIEVGLAAWVVALVVTLVVPALHEGDRDWWPWACVAGFALGGIGWAYVRRGRGNARDAA